MSQVCVTPAEEQEPVCTHLTKRPSRFSIRRKVPINLQSHYRRSKIVKALGTSDRREAERLCRVAGAKLDEEFARVRAALAALSSAAAAPTPAPANPKPTLTVQEAEDRERDELEHLAEQPIEDELLSDEAVRTADLREAIGRDSACEIEARASAPIPFQAPRTEAVNADYVAMRTLALLRRRRYQAAKQGPWELAKFMERQRMSIDMHEGVPQGDMESPPDLPLSAHEGYRNALRAFLASGGSVKELSQDELSAQPARPAQSKVVEGTTLREVAGKWANERNPIPRTVGQANKVMGRFEEHMGDMKVEQMTRRHVVEFKDKLLEAGQTGVNTNKQLMILSILLNFAECWAGAGPQEPRLAPSLSDTS